MNSFAGFSPGRDGSAEALLAGQNRILEMIAVNAPLEETLGSLVRLIESQFEATLCSVVLLDEDGQHMRHGAGPSLPEAYRKAIDGTVIGPKVGSCGTAMFRGEAVIVTDILEDPLWEDYRALASEHGLRACWSTPIASHQGKVLGSFAMYYREPRSPGFAEMQLSSVGTRIAGIAIERWQGDLERQRAAETYRALVENLNDVVFSLDAEGRFSYVSPIVETLSGYKVDEVVGRPFSLFTDPEDFPSLQDSFASMAAGRRSPFEFRVFDKSGKVRWCRSSSRRVMAGDRVIGVTGILQDITQFKQAQARLEESEKRLRDVYERAPVGIAVVDSASGRFLWVNPRYCEIAGRTEDEMLHLDFQSITHPDDLADNLSRAQALTKGEIPHVETEKRYVRPDGSAVWVSVSAAPLGGQEEMRQCNLVMVQDITERKFLERQLLQAQKMESLGSLAGGIAHDFNNVLGVILGQGELLLQKLAPSDASRRRVEQICQAGRRAGLLTQQLLAFSRQQLMQPTTLDLNGVVEDFSDMLASLIGEDVTLVRSLDPELGRVSADAGQVEQVLMNLAVNARDAMPRGGTITIRTSNMEMDAPFVRQHHGTKPGRCVVLSVSDTGSGMDEQTAARIFDPFFTTKGWIRERGLGCPRYTASSNRVVATFQSRVHSGKEPRFRSTCRVSSRPGSQRTKRRNQLRRPEERKQFYLWKTQWHCVR